MRKQRNKYGARRTQCWQDHPPHPSKLEAEYCNTLALLKKNGDIQDYVTQKRFDFIVNGKKICSHLVDFYVQDNNGVWSVQETKGKSTDLWRIKYKLFCALYPGIHYEVIR